MRLVRYTYPNYRSVMPSSGLTRSPWAGLETEIDQLFANTLRDFTGAMAPDHFPLDIYEDANNTYVRAELPGLAREDINVEMAEGNLTISASRKVGGEKEDEAEESFAFSRSVGISDDIDTSKVAATYDNGVLTVTLPKREEAKTKKITVSVK